MPKPKHNPNMGLTLALSQPPHSHENINQIKICINEPWAPFSRPKIVKKCHFREAVKLINLSVISGYLDDLKKNVCWGVLHLYLHSKAVLPAGYLKNKTNVPDYAQSFLWTSLHLHLLNKGVLDKEVTFW